MNIKDPLHIGVCGAVTTCCCAGVIIKTRTRDNVLNARPTATQHGIYTTGGVIMKGHLSVFSQLYRSVPVSSDQGSRQEEVRLPIPIMSTFPACHPPPTKPDLRGAGRRSAVCESSRSSVVTNSRRVTAASRTLSPSPTRSPAKFLFSVVPPPTSSTLR